MLSGCGDSASDGSTASPSASVASDGKTEYVEAVNALCGELLPKVLTVTDGGHPKPYPIAVFLEEQPRIEQLTAAFDKRFDAIPVPEDAKPVAEAFDRYRAEGDAATNRLDSAADAGDQKAFDEAFKANLEDFETSNTRTDLLSLGITAECNSR